MTALPQPVVGKPPNGGRFDFDDGGTYCGGWEDGKAHGHGVCTGPKGQGEYCGSWHFGFEVSGTYTWPSGSTYDGQWQNGKRHGLGVESRGRWVYRGEWTQGFKGRYGVRQSTTSVAKYEGTWANGLQDGYGSETYADTGTYKGQWLRGLRHGYGVRTSAQYSQASVSRHKGNTKGSSSSLRSDGTGDPLADRDKKIDDGRGGFVLRARSDDIRRRRGSLSDKSNFRNVFKGLKIRRQRSTGDIGTGGRQTGSIRSNSSSTSWMSTESGQSAYTVGDVPEDGSNASFIVEDEQLDGSVTETYLGEWKNDKRTGFGACERSDGIRYEGEWYNNKKYGYGVTTFKDGSKEEGKYKNNVLITSNKKKHVFLIRSAKFRERIEAAVAAAQRASKIAMQKEDIAISRTATARGKAEQADIAAIHATEDSDLARIFARQFAPDFIQPGVDFVKVSSKSHKPHHADINNKVGNSRAKNNPNSHNNHKPNSIHRNSDIMMTDDFPKRDHEQEMLHQDDDNCPNFDRDSLDNEYDSSNHTNTRLDNSLSHIPSRKNSTLSDSYDHHNRATIRGSRSQVRDVVGRASNNVQNDRFDHYNRPPSRPPSRDRSVDRYNSRGQTPVSSSAEQSYIRPRVAVPSSSSQKAQDWTPDSGVFEDEVSTAPTVSSRRSSRHTAPISEENTPPLTGNGCIGGGGARHLYNIPSNQKEAEVFLRQRACGQEIPLVPAPGGPFKRTESLYINPIIRKQAQMKQSPAGNSTSLKRKKSLPEVQQIDDSTPIMPREEAAALSSQQRHIVRQRAEESEKYRANPLLYLTSPSVQDWFSKQRLVMLILFLNLSLALMFFKLLS